MQIKAIKDRVTKILELYPDTRDSDMELIAIMWKRDLGQLGSIKTALDVLVAIKHSKVTCPASIVRVRRKLQKDNPKLQGTKYTIRAAEEEKVKQELRTFNN